MEKLKENKKAVVVFILLLIAISLGVSYAYWLIVKTQTGNNIISSACLNITFTGENDIQLSNAYPMNDEELYEFLTTTTPYHFTITNECEEETNVVINLETLGEEETKLGDQYMDVILYNGEKNFEEILTKNQQKTQVYSKKGESHSYNNVEIYDYKLTNNLENSDKVLEEAIKAYRLYEFTLKGKESKSFNLIEYMSQDTPALEETMNKEFRSKITVSTAYSPPLTRNMLAARTCSTYCSNNPNSVFQDEYIKNTTKIVFANTMNPPSTYVASYDESSLQDESVIAYVIENEEAGTYTIEFQTDGIFLMKSGQYYFSRFSNVTEIEGLEYIDTSKVTNMYDMFSYMTNLTTLDVSHFDTSNVTNMSYMFSHMSNLTTLDVTNFDTSNVTDMHNMFSYMEDLTELDVSNFNTSNVTDMSSMFKDVKNLTKLNVSTFDTSNVKNMSYMFYNMRNLSELDVSNFNTSNVTNMSNMFYGMSSLITLDVSNFDTSKVTNMNYMFSGMRYLITLDVSHFDTSQVTNMSNMFYGMSSLITLDLSNFDTSKVTDMSHMFQNMNKLTELDVSNFNTSNVTNMSDMFWTAESLATLDISNFDTSKVTNMSHMFHNMSKLTELDVSNFDTSNVTDMNNMFRSTSSINSLDVGNFDTSNVTNMSNMFTGMSSLTTLDVSEFNTSKVTDMSEMFSWMSNLITLDLSNFDTSNVTNMSNMFLNDHELTNITYGDNFIYANSATITNMYDNCPANKPTDSSWDGAF